VHSDSRSGAGVETGSESRKGGRILIRGELILAVLVAIAAGVLIQQRQETSILAVVAPELPPMAAEAVPADFRADAWYLPDEPLLGFVEIPAGSFLMGSDPARDPGAYENERWSPVEVQGAVTLPSYLISRYPVTVAQFRAFVDATGHAASPGAFAAPPAHPVTEVSWPDALAYARWLEEELGTSPDTPAELTALLEDGFRILLPSEAEWEKAARGDDGRIFPWGDAPRTDRATFQSGGTTRVGSHDCPECPYGLADMSGNVWEWTRSPFQPYPWDPAERPHDMQADALWVMRGGAFNDTPQNIRAAVRGGADPGARRPFLGFRLVITTF
jgi:formylglycine-generating enzyme required for sulfatase activity